MGRFVRLFVYVSVVVVGLVSSAWAEERYTYTVKGIVRALPGNGRAANEVLVKHEPIPEYRDESGKVVGMMAMTMPFYLGENVSAADLLVGDAVEMVVEQSIKPTFSERVVKIAKVK